MPTREERTSWGVCWKWGFIPYPCKKKKKVWCYDASSVGKHCYGILEVIYICENGEEYKHTDWFGCFGKYEHYDLGFRKRCFGGSHDHTGSCREGYSIPRGGNLPQGQSGNALTAAGATTQVAGGLVAISPTIPITWLMLLGSIPIDLQAIITMVYGIILSVLGVSSLRRGCHSGGCLSILLTLLMILLILFSYVVPELTLIVGIILAILGGILSTLGAQGPCIEGSTEGG